MRILIDSIYSLSYIAYKIGTDLLELCKHGKIYHLNLTIKVVPCRGVATEGQTALPPPVLAAHPAAPFTIKMSTRFRGIVCKNIVPVGQQKVLVRIFSEYCYNREIPFTPHLIFTKFQSLSRAKTVNFL